MKQPLPLELLAPAKDLDTALAAIACGADAIYIGGPTHGARSRAANSVDDIRRLCLAAHPYGVRVYVTLNTIVYEQERDRVTELAWELWHAGVDALIVQDTRLTGLHLPPIDLHASTQCDIRTPGRARELAALGMTRLVVPRELTMDETRAMADAVPGVELEAFVHGALCVCYSGDCRAGYVVAGRSANRGECPQLCRLPYTLTDARGNVLARDAHLLSLRDLNRLDMLGALAAAGVCSFKIEGRLKDAGYVMETVTAYSRALDALIAAEPGCYRRASFGRSQGLPEPDLDKCFNRGYTHYFSTDTYLHGKPVRMATFDSPARKPEPIGRIVHAGPRAVTVKAVPGMMPANSDGMVSLSEPGNGFRVNRAEPGRKPGEWVLHTRDEVRLRPGDRIGRTFDRAHESALADCRPVRTMAMDAAFRPIPGGVALDLCDEAGRRVTATLHGTFDAANKPQDAAQLSVLSRTGDTPWRLNALDNSAGGLFIPAAQLTALRRRAVELLATLPAVRRRLRPAGTEGIIPMTPVEDTPAAELRRTPVRVMTTRYCLRREMGRCLLTPAGREWPEPLTLTGPGGAVFDTQFDCKACRMHLLYHPD